MTWCWVAPPALIWLFLCGTPPNDTNSLQCSAMTSHGVCIVISSSIDATMCGISTRAAARLYESWWRT